MQHILKCPLELLKLSWPETVRPDPLHLCLWMGSHPGSVVPWKLQMKNTDMWTHVWNLWCVLFPRKAWIWLWVLLGHAIFAGHGVYFEVGPKTFGWKELIHSICSAAQLLSKNPPLNNFHAASTEAAQCFMVKTDPPLCGPPIVTQGLNGV